MTDITTVDPLITETADRLFSQICDHESIQRAEAEGGAPQIWDAFAETGFPWISIDEASGGSGGSLLDALEVLRLVGYHAAPIPAAENGVLAGWLLAASNQEIPLLTPVLNNPAVKSLPPQSVITYQGSQILLNSDRLVFNTKADSIILNSQQSVSIASKGPIGLYSQNNDFLLRQMPKQIHC